jgi:hypothetical protein
MEADLAVELVTNSPILKASKTEVAVLIGDDDSSTFSALRKASNGSIVKWSLSDINHAKKALSSMLYNCTKSHNPLTTAIIKYLKRCFGYTLTQNKGISSGVRDAI